MTSINLNKPVNQYMLLRNHVFRHVAPRVYWNKLKSEAQKAGVDTSKFNKNLGPALDTLVRSLMSAKEILARPGGQVAPAQKLAMHKQFRQVEDIVNAYVLIVKAEKHKPGATAAQVSALESLKCKLKDILNTYGPLVSERAR